MLNLEGIPSAWSGHKNFAQWLVKEVKPKVTVELGVDRGFSLFCFSEPNIGTVYGIDTFEGDPTLDPFTFKHDDAEAFVKEFIASNNMNNIKIVKADFNDVVEFWSLPIDILHIDGCHLYDYVKNDWEKWNKFVGNQGIVLFHDTESYPNDVGRLFSEIDNSWFKFNFKHSAGLGIASKNFDLVEKIKRSFITV